MVLRTYFKLTFHSKTVPPHTWLCNFRNFSDLQVNNIFKVHSWYSPLANRNSTFLGRISNLWPLKSYISFHLSNDLPCTYPCPWSILIKFRFSYFVLQTRDSETIYLVWNFKFKALTWKLICNDSLTISFT